MPFKVIAPERKVFTLKETDALYGNDGDPTTVEIRLATVRQNAQREELYADFRTETVDGKTTQVLHLPMYDLMCRETFLTLTDCNITGQEDKPLFRFKSKDGGQILDMSYEQFKAEWGKLPEGVAMEIHKKVLEMNPHWQFTAKQADLGE